MRDDGSGQTYWPPGPSERRRTRNRGLLMGGAALALLLIIGLGVLLGSRMIGAQAAGLVPSQGFGPAQTFASTPGAQGQSPGQCDALTVTSVSGQTIVATVRNSASFTIHTTSATTYTKAGAAATASAVTVGSHIHAQGTRNSDGSIAATSIDVQ